MHHKDMVVQVVHLVGTSNLLGDMEELQELHHHSRCMDRGLGHLLVMANHKVNLMDNHLLQVRATASHHRQARVMDSHHQQVRAMGSHQGGRATIFMVSQDKPHQGVRVLHSMVRHQDVHQGKPQLMVVSSSLMEGVTNNQEDMVSNLEGTTECKLLHQGSVQNCGGGFR